jgi:hypothetical protein
MQQNQQMPVTLQSSQLSCSGFLKISSISAFGFNLTGPAAEKGNVFILMSIGTGFAF